jgi:hypothetical protein
VVKGAESVTLFGDTCAWLHGGCGTTEYLAYVGAKTRCQNPENPQWPYYGRRGIEFRFLSFAVFRDHLGRRPAGKILGRIRSGGHFEIGNVRWTTRRKSAKNRKAYRKARATICGHPKHHAKGLCRSCYEATPTVRARKAAYALVDTFRSLAKLRCPSIRVATLTDGITHLGGACVPIDAHRKGAQ